MPATLSLQAINGSVWSLHTPDGTHVGNLKHIGGLWKFKAVGYDASGAVCPGDGPLTDHHNAIFQTVNLEEINARLGMHIAQPGA